MPSERHTGKGPAPPHPRAPLAALGQALEQIATDVIACERCPRLREYCEAIAREKKREFRDWDYWGKPVPGFGDPAARLMIVGLAPAAHGGNRTGRVFTGDSSGDWLFEALHRHAFATQAHSVARGDGLELRGCYVCAAGRCAPPDNKPTRLELDRCQEYLEREIAALPTVRVVLVLGSIGHERWLKASGWWSRLPVRERPRFGHGVETRMPDGRVLLSSYHPSRQNTNTGKLTRAMWHSVFARARELLSAEGGL